MYEKIISAMQNAEKIGIFMHINPDGDCIGSALAIYTFLLKKGKSVTIFAPESTANLPPKLSLLKNFDKLISVEGKERFELDLAVAVDAAAFGRLSDNNARIFVKAKKKIAIDHHASHEEYADLTLLEKDASSTAEIIYKLLSFWDKLNIDKDIAEMIFTGMVTDTGCFAYSSVSSDTFLIASKLLSHGINNGEIIRNVEKNKSLPVFNLTNRILSNIKLHLENTMAVITFSMQDFQETGTTEYDTEGIINNALNIDSVELAISIAQIKDKSFKISFRSKEKVDVSALAACFGGGGHIRAAGCRINGYFEDVYNKIVNVATEMIGYA